MRARMCVRACAVLCCVVCVCVCVCVRARALMRVLLCTRQRDGVTDDQTDGHAQREKTHKNNSPLSDFSGEGNSVGEVALIDETCVRTASIVADAKTDLVIVDKPLYTRCVKDTLAKEFEDKRQFIINNPLFASWAPKYRKQLTMAPVSYTHLTLPTLAVV